MAGILMILSGVFQAIQGLAAIINERFFDRPGSYAFDLDMGTWGVIHFVGGIIVAIAGVALFTGAVWPRIVAIVIASIATVVSFFTIPYYPVWSLLIIAFNVAIIWALTVHGDYLKEMSG